MQTLPRSAATLLLGAPICTRRPESGKRLPRRAVQARFYGAWAVRRTDATGPRLQFACGIVFILGPGDAPQSVSSPRCLDWSDPDFRERFAERLAEDRQKGTAGSCRTGRAAARRRGAARRPAPLAAWAVHHRGDSVRGRGARPLPEGHQASRSYDRFGDLAARPGGIAPTSQAHRRLAPRGPCSSVPAITVLGGISQTRREPLAGALLGRAQAAGPHSRRSSVNGARKPSRRSSRPEGAR